MRNRIIINFIKGLISFIPLSDYIYSWLKKETSHSSSNARFCYSFSLRTYICLYNNNLKNKFKNIAELGASSSFGIGIAFLILGAETYSVLEVSKHDNKIRNLKLLDEIIYLFRNCEDIPSDEEFPQINIKLQSYKFPKEIFTKNVLESLLDESRIQLITDSILSNSNRISYYVPWQKYIPQLTNSFDLLISRAVMEHVKDYSQTYSEIYLILNEEGLMVHDIEYHNHKIGKNWNSHWTFTNLSWFLLKGTRPSIINRATHSDHLIAISRAQFNIVCSNRTIQNSSIERKNLAHKFRNMSEEDLISYGGFIVAKK